MQSVSKLLAGAMRVETLLAHAEKYLAHLPRKDDAIGKPSETLGEHMTLVLQYAAKIIELHQLDRILERLIAAAVAELGFIHPEMATDKLSELFADAIAFHDFGKVNEFFQSDRMKNNDPAFQRRFPEIFAPKHGHSELGAYIFNVFHLEKINALDIPDADEADKVKLSALALFFSNSILLHHSPKLVKPGERVARSQFVEKRGRLEKYLRLYQGFPTVGISEAYFENLAGVLEEFEDSKSGFALFALLRLNFSLLTAADYLATGQYSYDLELKDDQDWGILSGQHRDDIIHAARHNPKKEYNTQAYDLFEKTECGEHTLQHPENASGDNLNTLRTEMAIEVLGVLKKHPDKRLFYLEAPTGGGKTNLSMLAVAELLRANPELTKVFYVFPFTTLITQTHKAIKETLLLTDANIALLHSRAGFQTAGKRADEPDEEGEDGIYGGQRKDFLQNLFALYPFTLVTHVRFFDILKSNRKDDIYLMHRLANSIVVLDELQSYPPKQWDKMLHLLDRYGHFFNIRFILMSATLPRLDGIEAVRRASGGQLPEVVDLLPKPERYFQNRNFRGRVEFKFDLLTQYEDITADELAVEVLEKSRTRAAVHAGRVFTIVEFIFKKSATEFRGVLDKKEAFFDEIMVLSGTILESQRRKIINRLKQKRKAAGLKILLITTQVVEAGVDIDMDLGFKNVSLIDSDEQLAGRVNRNVDKQGCEVWLFRKDDPRVLYKSDLRYQITRDLPPEFHQEILETKNFRKLYDRVFVEIEKKNKSEMAENFEQDYRRYLQKVDFPKVDEKLKLIDQKTFSVFIPARLPVEIEGEDGKPEPFFNDFELEFLGEKAKIWKKGDPEVDGAAVWTLYRETLSNPNADFIAKKIEQKVMQGILAKFTFSMFSSDTNRAKLAANSQTDKNLDEYFYLNRWQEDQIYSLESGLDEAKLDDQII